MSYKRTPHLWEPLRWKVHNITVDSSTTIPSTNAELTLPRFQFGLHLFEVRLISTTGPSKKRKLSLTRGKLLFLNSHGDLQNKADGATLASGTVGVRGCSAASMKHICSYVMVTFCNCVIQSNVLKVKSEPSVLYGIYISIGISISTMRNVKAFVMQGAASQCDFFRE